jgi:2-polyprenyl-6-methoxyphenol hydroxylase-like FAD-dependent oxidoreductase
MAMVLTGRKIAIVGGGPGGLTLASLLQLKGVDVTVYERDVDAAVRIQGGALDLHTESGLAALEKAGLIDEFKARYRQGAELMRVTDDQANIFADQHTDGSAVAEKFGDKHHRPEIDRGPLRDILLNSLKPGTVVWNSHIVSAERDHGGWKLFFHSGREVYADIVVGADGANSKIRTLVTDIKPFWTGITMIEGSIKDAKKTAPIIHGLLKGGKIFAFGNEQTLIVSSKADGSFGFGVSFKSSEHWVKESGIDFKDNNQMLAWFKKEFVTWSDTWWELFSCETTLFIPRPQYCMPLDQRWEANSDITLLGDAAHWMPPFAGEGVNMAMLDALQLSEALTDPSFSDARSAIAQFEKQMFKRFAKIGEGTLFNTRWMHEPAALDSMLAMFSKNKFRQMGFIGKMWLNIFVFPFFRKTFRLTPRQGLFIAGRPN